MHSFMNKEYLPFGMGPVPETPEQADALWKVFKPEMSKETENLQTMRAAIEKAKELGFVPGAPVRWMDDPEIGEVISYNESIGSFYPGSRYPVRVKFVRGTFEYGLEDLTLVEI